MTRSYQFTSESVSKGHPDKMADQISDAILDAILKEDKRARVACEALVKTGMVLVAGEISTDVYVDIEGIVREVVLDIGYDHSIRGFDGNTCAVLNAIGEQSPDIAQGVGGKAKGKGNGRRKREQGAGDQGLMFGYATDETKERMPAPIVYAHRLMQRHEEVRKSGSLPWLEPDAKSQITFRYKNDRPVAIDAVVLSTQHHESVGLRELRAEVKKEIILPVLEETGWLRAGTDYHINPTGRFVIGGPLGDCGLTGRKIIVDTYGGMARHGGGAFSGKDPSKVDRSATYLARYIAKNIVAARLARRCEVQLSYAIGVAEPTSVSVNTFSTGKVRERELERLVRSHFKLTPAGLIDMLNLLRPIYQQTAAYGHFGRSGRGFSWERTDKAKALRADAGI